MAFPRPGTGGGGAPSGPAGGALGGTYPNPSLASVITAGGPTGNSNTIPIITYNAAGQLSNVTTVTVAGAGIDTSALHQANNLNDVASVPTSKTNLKVGYPTRTFSHRSFK